MNNATTAHDVVLQYIFNMRMHGARDKSDCFTSLSERGKALSTIAWNSLLKCQRCILAYISWQSDEQKGTKNIDHYIKRYLRDNRLHPLSLPLSSRQVQKTASIWIPAPSSLQCSSHGLRLDCRSAPKHAQRSSSYVSFAAIPSYLVLRCAMAQVSTRVNYLYK